LLSLISNNTVEVKKPKECCRQYAMVKQQRRAALRDPKAKSKRRRSEGDA
jgi:hypothetical protein